MTCSACGVEVRKGDAFCEGCGAPLRQQPPTAGTPDADSAWIRWGAAGFLAVAGAWGFFFRVGVGWLGAMAPLIVGALITALRIPAIETAVQRWGPSFQARRLRAAGRGKFSRFVSRPVFACAFYLWKMPSAVADAHLRTGIRVAILSYLFAAVAALLAAAAYIVVGLVIAVLLIVAVSWLMSLASGQSSPRMPGIPRPRGPFGGDPAVANYRKGYEQALQNKDNVAATAAFATLVPLQDTSFQQGYQDAMNGKKFEPK